MQSKRDAGRFLLENGLHRQARRPQGRKNTGDDRSEDGNRNCHEKHALIDVRVVCQRKRAGRKESDEAVGGPPRNHYGGSTAEQTKQQALDQKLADDLLA